MSTLFWQIVIIIIIDYSNIYNAYTEIPSTRLTDVMSTILIQFPIQFQVLISFLFMFILITHELLALRCLVSFFW